MRTCEKCGKPTPYTVQFTDTPKICIECFRTVGQAEETEREEVVSESEEEQTEA